LFRAEEDRTGITDSEIRLCVHAALTYGAAFDIGAEDLNVYWSAVNDAGGVHGRAVRVFYENDNYTPTDAVRAATACRDKHDPFMLLGGIGFDQIPAVRTWAEQNRMLYFHHTATVNGSEGRRFSYTALPTTEKVGEMFAELAASRFRGQKVGIIKRQSENWEPGVVAFEGRAAELGVQIVLERPVPQNKGSYLQDILDLRNAGAEVTWLWLNALETTNFVSQAKAQGLESAFMVFPFNLTTQALDAQALDPPLVGVAMWNAYSFGDRTGPFAAYADDLAQFEEQYRRYRPSVDLSGVSGDLLFLNWSAQKAMHKLLLLCGSECSRNRFLDLLRGFDQKLTSSACRVDFTRAGEGNSQRGGWAVSVLEAYRAPDGKVNFRNAATCVEGLL
jgi:ABC-type branched-subunit amino acid transport system substrate-binding protein